MADHLKHFMFAIIQNLAFACLLYGATPDSISNAVSIRRIFPSEYVLSVSHPITSTKDGITVQLYARAFDQGNLVYLEILPENKMEKNDRAVNCTFEHIGVLLTAFAWGYRGFFALPPDISPGEKMLVLEYQGVLQPVQHVVTFSVGKTNFPVYHQSMNVGKFSDVNNASDPQVKLFIERCTIMKKEVFSLQSEDLLTSVLAHPRDRHYVTSQFWSTRIYQRYEIKDGKKITHPSETRYHRGVDFRGSRGEPVYALADGRVVLAEKMYYEGNFTVINHGNRIFSHYMHQDSIIVKEGQFVRGGEKIGTVGTTGVSTGPHLHVSLIVNGTQVDPLSILSLPIRN
jgi:hypothetical protein